jgi:hypothetical protein
MIPGSPKEVFWIDSNSVPPVCDIPWVGRAIIEPTGELRFCCFASRTVGNINRSSFEELWNGADMQRIRHELAEQRLPAECQTAACPIYRGDKLNYIVRRLEELQVPADFTQFVRPKLCGSLRINWNAVGGRGVINIDVELIHADLCCTADLVIGIRLPDGTQTFLPNFEAYPVPICPGLAIGGESPIRLSFGTGQTENFSARGVYEVCAAVFGAKSDLNFLSNCYWSDTATITL